MRRLEEQRLVVNGMLLHVPLPLLDRPSPSFLAVSDLTLHKLLKRLFSLSRPDRNRHGPESVVPREILSSFLSTFLSFFPFFLSCFFFSFPSDDLSYETTRKKQLLLTGLDWIYDIVNINTTRERASWFLSGIKNSRKRFSQVAYIVKTTRLISSGNIKDISEF